MVQGITAERALDLEFLFQKTSALHSVASMVTFVPRDRLVLKEGEQRLFICNRY